MTPTELEIFLRVQKIRPIDLAAELRVTPAELSTCISGRRRNDAIRKKLAKYFHKSVDQLFGPDHAAAVSVREVA